MRLLRRLALLALAFSSCSIPLPFREDPAATIEHPLLALRAGEERRYDYRDLTPNGRSYSFLLVSRGPREIPVAGVAVVVDEVSSKGIQPTGYVLDEGFVVEVLGLRYDPAGELLWQGTEDARRLGFREVSNRKRLMPLDVRVGTRWSEDTQIVAAHVRIESEVVAREAIDVAAGRFGDAYHVESTMRVAPAPREGEDPVEAAPAEGSADYAFSDWYVAGVGLVRSYVRLVDGTPIAEIVLTSYDRRGG